MAFLSEGPVIDGWRMVGMRQFMKTLSATEATHFGIFESEVNFSYTAHDYGT